MQHKIISEAIKLTQNDIDYLWFKSYQYLTLFGHTEDWKEKTHYYLLFQAYWDLYLANRENVHE